MLLDTARALIVRDGEAGLTLGAVADEAGLARATIYGYFSGKRDLLAALDTVSGSQEAPEQSQAQDAEADSESPNLETVSPAQQPETIIAAPDVIPTADAQNGFQTEFAFPTEAAPAQNNIHPETAAEPVEEISQNIEQVEQPPADGTPEELHADPSQPEPGSASIPDHVPETQVAADVSEPEQAVAEVAPQEPVVVASDADPAEPVMPHEQERRLQAAHLEEIAKRLILPESALKEGTDAIISRLETRLRVLERSISGLEARQAAIPDETANKIKPIADMVTQLQSRADAMEDRQRQALAELRLSIHELTARQNAMGAVASVAVPEAPAWPEVATLPVKVEEAPITQTPLEKSEDEKIDETARTAYLLTARNLAKEGARQAAERESQIEEDQRRRRRHLLMAATVAGVCMLAVSSLILLRPGPHGISVAQSKSISRAVVEKDRRAFVSMAPLDRLTALADRGDAKAELVVGLKYLKGDGVPASDRDAARWFERAAKAGNAVAQNHLGALYQAGRGVPADTNQAQHWYEAAATQGDRHAMSNLAVLYAGGGGGTKNFAEAARWFQRSAELGYVDAQFNLAVLFERGDGVPQSLLDAYKWYSVAATAGDPVAKTRAEAIATQVSSEELQAAQTEAANFKPRPMNRAANDIPTMAQALASR